MITPYPWGGPHPIDYEKVDLPTGPKGFDQAKVEAAEYGFLVIEGGPVRVLWFKGCSATLSSSEGVVLFDHENVTLTRHEMRYFLAELDTVATTAVLRIHYYA